MKTLFFSFAKQFGPLTCPTDVARTNTRILSKFAKLMVVVPVQPGHPGHPGPAIKVPVGHLTTLYIEHLTTPWPVPGHGPFLHFALIISGGVTRYLFLIVE